MGLDVFLEDEFGEELDSYLDEGGGLAAVMPAGDASYPMLRYVDSEGVAGYFQLNYQVYGRGGLPCRRCATTLKSIRQGGRATTYCPKCQK